MNKYHEAIEVIDTLLHLMCGAEREDGCEPTMEEMSNSMDLLKELVDKTDSFEWIPVTERLPEEHESAFAKVYGTDQWNNALWRTRSKEVLVSIEFDDGNRSVTTSFTMDGKWHIERRRLLHDFKVIAWKELPEPYKEKDNGKR